jgi:hypothetical protein
MLTLSICSSLIFSFFKKKSQLAYALSMAVLADLLLFLGWLPSPTVVPWGCF